MNNEVELYENVLSEEDRLTLLRTSMHCMKRVYQSPGLQTEPDFHLKLKELNQFSILQKIIKKTNIDKKIEMCWGNYTDKEEQYINWHTHNYYHGLKSPSRRHIVYYIHNPEEKGTWFNTDGEITKLNAKENSMIIIPNHLVHSVPSDITKPRVSIAIDFKDC